MAIILLSPRISLESLNPDMLSCRRFEEYADRFSTRCVYSCHSPSMELHGIFRDCVPILINLLMISYLSMWFGIDTLSQNLSAVRTNRILLLVAPSLHLSLNVRCSQIFSNISFGRSSSVVAGALFILDGYLTSLYDNKPLSGCTARSNLLRRSSFLNFQPTLGCDTMKQ